MTKNSLQITFLALVLVLVLSAFFFTFRRQARELDNETVRITVPVTNEGDITRKTVRVSDGIVTFSFEVPENWLVERRNDGEMPMDEEALRNFLATAYRGKDAQATPDKQVSDYAHITWKELQKMDSASMKKLMAERAKEVGPYPSASVSSSDHIWYTDWNGFQIDFYLTDILIAKRDLQLQKTRGVKLSDEVVGGMRAMVEQYALDDDGQGNQVVSKGGSGGKQYTIFISQSNRALVINKQAFGDVGFESNFHRLLNSLQFVVR